MLEFGVIDEIVEEPGGAHTNSPQKMAKTLKSHIKKELPASAGNAGRW